MGGFLVLNPVKYIFISKATIDMSIDTVKIERVISVSLVAPNRTVKISKFANLFSCKLM